MAHTSVVGSPLVTLPVLVERLAQCDLVYSVSILFALCLLTSWVKTFWIFKSRAQHDGPKVPPYWPYTVPSIGPVVTTLSFALSRNPVNWVLSSR